MTNPRPGPAQKLVELLEGLPPEDRKEITAWLLGMGRRPVALTFGPNPARLSEMSTGVSAELHNLLPRLASALPAGEESQLVTIRLPMDRHSQLRAWCSEHGFTMASVVRGLVERFLEQQAPRAKPAEEQP